MPGIVGFIGSLSSEKRMAAVNQMVGCMLHESFYTSGVYHAEEAGISVGWVAREGSFSDCNPIWNEKRDILLVFSGENFVDDSVGQRLRASGHQFDVENASSIVHLYEEEGTKFLARMNGTFGGVLVDFRQNVAFAFNDRYGMHRLYLHENADGLWFSSEAKSLLKVLPELRRIDPTALAEFGSCGCALQNRTLFAGISLMPPASLWTFSHRRLEKKEAYFRAEEWENQPKLSEAEFYENLKATFCRILPKYFRGAEKIGVSLTGGLDGRMIMAWNRNSPGSLPCYTFGSSYRDCTDVTFARRVAKSCGQPHQVLGVDDEFLGQFPQMAERAVYLSDGAMDVSGAVELYVNRRAREIAPVRVTGNYGSEVLRSNVAFRPHGLSRNLFAPDFVDLDAQISSTYQEEAKGNRLSFIAFKQVPWHHYSRLAVEQSQVTMRSPYLDDEIVSLVYRAPESLQFSKTPALRLIAEGNPDLGRIPTDRGLVYAPTPILTRLHNLYQEFTFRAEYAYDYGMPQWLARMDRGLASLKLERAFLGRHKFYHFRVWYRDQLGSYLKAILLDARSLGRCHVDGRKLETLVNEHVSGLKNHTSELHQALSIELTYRTLIEQ